MLVPTMTTKARPGEDELDRRDKIGAGKELDEKEVGGEVQVDGRKLSPVMVKVPARFRYQSHADKCGVGGRDVKPDDLVNDDNDNDDIEVDSPELSKATIRNAVKSSGPLLSFSVDNILAPERRLIRGQPQNRHFLHPLHQEPRQYPHEQQHQPHHLLLMNAAAAAAAAAVGQASFIFGDQHGRPHLDLEAKCKANLTYVKTQGTDKAKPRYHKPKV